MTRFREIKKYGDTWIIKLNPIDATDYKLVEGDMVDIEELNLLKEGVKK
jgi:hypothetical protein